MTAVAAAKRGRPKNQKVLRGPTDVGRRKIAKAIANGKTRGEVASEFGVTVVELKKHYDYELKLAESLMRQEAAAAQGKQTQVRANSRFTFNRPDPCRIPPRELVKIAANVAKWDEAGVPCDARGAPLFGKKELARFDAMRGFVGTDREDDTTISGVVRSLKQEDWDCSLVDWEERFMAGDSLIPGAIKKVLNDELAQKAVRIFKSFRLADVPGQPTLEEAGGEWLFEIVEVIMGCYDPVTKKRLLKEIFLLIPKKNMKTTGGALIMLLLLIYNERPNGEAIMTAPVHDVAEIAFKAIAGAIELDPDLSRVFLVQPHLKMVTDQRTQATLSVMTFDPATLTGQKLFAALIDELHVIAKNPKAASALRQIRGGMTPFQEAILIFITTQSEDAPQGVFESELTAARNIRDGKRKGAKNLAVLYEFPEPIQKSTDQKWKNPAIWELVTPNLDRSIALETLVTQFGDAESKGEAEVRSWASQHLNIQIGLALRSNAWAGAKVWEAGVHDSTITLQQLLKRCEVVEVGVDGGGLSDLLALVVAGREKETGKWLAWAHAWAHPSVLEYHKALAPMLQDLEKADDLTMVKEPGDDIDQLVDFVIECNKAGLLDKVGLDPYGVGGIVDALLVAGIAQESIVGVSQGWRLGGAIKTLERALADKRLITAGQKLLNWCVGNAQVETRGNAILITKAASGSGKIDALMALLDAIFLLATNPEAKSKKHQMIILGARGAVPQRKAA